MLEFVLNDNVNFENGSACGFYLLRYEIIFTYLNIVSRYKNLLMGIVFARKHSITI